MKKTLVVLVTMLVMSLTACADREEKSAADEAVTPEPKQVESVTASTMRLARVEGQVQLSDKEGARLPVSERMRLYDGNAVDTGELSRAGISLDNAKAATVGETSRAELHQDGKRLEMDLISGEMYFSVSSPLDADESFDIHTSTIVLGIRGTSGYVSAESEQVASVILTSGHAVITAATGEQQSIAPGQRVDVTATPSGTTFTVTDIRPRDYPLLLLEELFLDETMLDQAEEQNDPGLREEIDAALAGESTVSLPESVIGRDLVPLKNGEAHLEFAADGSFTHTTQSIGAWGQTHIVWRGTYSQVQQVSEHGYTLLVEDITLESYHASDRYGEYDSPDYDIQPPYPPGEIMTLALPGASESEVPNYVPYKFLNNPPMSFDASYYHINGEAYQG